VTLDHAAVARAALEDVCSGAQLESAHRYYDEAFVDHVNGQEFRGLAGVEKSVRAYRRVLRDVSIQVVAQVVQGGLVASRFVVRGTSHGRGVEFGGITISRLEEGLIVEDWSVLDALTMLRQLGPVRSAWVAMVSIGLNASRRPHDARQPSSERASTCSRNLTRAR
jgi:predicted ester cyclase